MAIICDETSDGVTYSVCEATQTVFEGRGIRVSGEKREGLRRLFELCKYCYNTAGKPMGSNEPWNEQWRRGHNTRTN